MNETLRVFFALWVPPDLAQAWSAASREVLGARFRAPEPETLHLTLVFLGQVEAARLGQLQALARSFEGRPGPELSVTSTGSFPDRGPARVLWVGLEEAGSELARLQADLENALRADGWIGPAKRARFVPHVTLGRPRGRAPLEVPQAFEDLRLEGAWRGEELRLVHSVPGAAGPQRFPLLGRVALR